MFNIYIKVTYSFPTTLISFSRGFQVKVGYENKCEELMNKGLDEADKMKELELLKVSLDYDRFNKLDFVSL